jgi:hypothetical protein
VRLNDSENRELLDGIDTGYAEARIHDVQELQR